MDGHVRCMVGIAVWGIMYGNREFGGEPGSLLLYIIMMATKAKLFVGVLCGGGVIHQCRGGHALVKGRGN